MEAAPPTVRIPGDLPTLETERLILRKLTPADEADVFAYASDPEVARLVPWEAHRSLDDTRRFLQGVLERYTRGEPDVWAIAEKASGRVIGTIRMGEYRAQHGRASVGYALARPYWNRGLTTEALRAVLRFGFDVVGLNRIFAVCYPEDPASARVMENVGMTYEGTLRDAAFEKGRYRSLKVYAILRREYDAPGRAPSPPARGGEP